MNWLQRLYVEDIDGLDDNYIAPLDKLDKIPHSGSNVTIRDEINHDNRVSVTLGDEVAVFPRCVYIQPSCSMTLPIRCAAASSLCAISTVNPLRSIV